MRRAAMRAIAMGMVVAGGVGAWAKSASRSPGQKSAPGATSGASVAAAAQAPGQLAPAIEAARGGRLHGVVKSGNTPLPGVTVTAQNTLTGKRYSTTTDITGAWSMRIPENGRYVIRTQFAAFATGTGETLLNAASHDQTVNFELILASRAAEQQQQEGRVPRRRPCGNWRATGRKT